MSIGDGSQVLILKNCGIWLPCLFSFSPVSATKLQCLSPRTYDFIIKPFLEAYRTESHDFYFDLDVLPGPVLKTQEEVLDAILHLPEIEEQYREKYEAFNKRFNYLDDEIADMFYGDL